jgi:hypothetical protein
MWILTASLTRNELILSSRDSSFYCRVDLHLDFSGSYLVVFAFPVRGCIHRVAIDISTYTLFLFSFFPPTPLLYIYGLVIPL